MFEAFLVVTVLIVGVGVFCAIDGSRDVFHPLVFIGPMMIFIYAWMPFKLVSTDSLSRYFQPGQLITVEKINVLGVLAFIAACLWAGVRFRGQKILRAPVLTAEGCRRLMTAGALAGSVGIVCWGISIINVGGFVRAYSTAYSGAWDDSGYIRDAAMLLLVGVLLSLTSLASGGERTRGIIQVVVISFPWLSQALLLGRRGPTFAYVIVVLMGWYTTRRKRPPFVAMGGLGFALGWLVLFLVTNRSNIYIGSSFDVKTDVSSVVETADTGNEYIYGSGTMLAAMRRNHYFWMRRYLAEILVRPIPSSIWPTKYADFGVPELLNNAGTGEGFADALGWVGAVGSAPGIVADLYVEVSWLCIPLMAVLGWAYGFVWRKAVIKGGPWSSQYVILSALSIYLVMQTMEAVIFRTIELSLPLWLAWRWALAPPKLTPVQVREKRLAMQGHPGYEHA
jgi:hypothetical protein